MDQSRYNEYVVRGRELIMSSTDNNFALGDLALELFPMNQPNGGGITEGLRKFADDIGSTLGHVQDCRSIADKYAKDIRRPGVSWYVYREFASQPSRADLIADDGFSGSVSAARAAMGRNTPLDGPSRSKRRITNIAFLSEEEKATEFINRALDNLRRADNKVESAVDYLEKAVAIRPLEPGERSLLKRSVNVELVNLRYIEGDILSDRDPD